MTTLKQLKDIIQSKKTSDQERQKAQAEWDLRHKTMLEEQQKEQFEKGFENESDSDSCGFANGFSFGCGVCAVGGGVMSRHSCLSHGEVAFCDGCLIDALKYEIENLKTQAISDAVEIQSLKDQLNNMERCYIEVKKERDVMLSRALDFKNIKEQRDIAETMLKKAQVICQRKLPDFGSALRAKADIDRVLRGEG